MLINSAPTKALKLNPSQHTTIRGMNCKYSDSPRKRLNHHWAVFVQSCFGLSRLFFFSLFFLNKYMILWLFCILLLQQILNSEVLRVRNFQFFPCLKLCEIASWQRGAKLNEQARAPWQDVLIRGCYFLLCNFFFCVLLRWFGIPNFSKFQ